MFVFPLLQIFIGFFGILYDAIMHGCFFSFKKARFFQFQKIPTIHPIIPHKAIQIHPPPLFPMGSLDGHLPVSGSCHLYV